MRIIEVRRHSIRLSHSHHLDQSGVTLARLVGENLGPFDRVVTSTLPRAFETALAMGFAVDEQVELLSTYGDDVEHEVPWPQSFAAYAKAVKRGGESERYAHRLASYYAGLADDLVQGRAALVINHGGVLELGVVASFPDAEYEAWGWAVEYCEGARLYWEDGKCVNAEVVRVSR